MQLISYALFLALCLNLSVAHGQVDNFKTPTQKDSSLPIRSIPVSSTPPLGFEALSETETTLIDIYYGGRPITTTIATFTPSEIKLSDLDSVLNLVEGVLNIAEVQIALMGNRPHKAEYLCPSEPYPGCGILEPEVADILFDIDKFRAYLFINPDYLKRPSDVQQKFLPLSNTGPGFIQLFNLSISGTVQDDLIYGLIGNTWFSYNQNHINALWYVNEQQNFRFETLSATHDSQSVHYSLGMLRTRGSRLINEKDFIGFSVASNMDTRIDLNQGSASLLQIYLPMRSRIDIYKQNQLLISGHYEAGHQMLKTDKLPSGAYEVTLRIQDQLGNVREETRFFSRTTDLPPADQALYFAEVGLLEQSGETDQILPQYSDDWLLHMGTRHRVTDTLGLGTTILASQEEVILEGSTTFISEYTRTSAAIMATSLQDYGVALQSHLHYKQLSGGVSYRQIWQNSDITESRSLLVDQASSQQLSTVLNYYTSYVNLSFNANWKQSEHGESSWAINPGVRIPLFKRRGLQLDLNIDYIHSSSGDELLGQFNLYGWSGRWSSRARLGSHTFMGSETDSRTEIIGNTSLNWNDKDLMPEELGIRLYADYQGKQSALGAGIRYRDDKTQIQLGVEQQLGRSGRASRTSYGGNLSYGVASDMEYFATGAANNGQSGIIVDLGGSAKTGTFEARVDGQSRGIIHASSRTLILLPAYKTYKIKLIPVNSSLASFDVSERQVTLYPGNIVTLSWQVDQAYVIFARILYPDGTLVSHARVRGVMGVATIDDAGLLQAEVDAASSELKITPLDHLPCTVQLPKFNSSEDIIMLGDLVCN